MEPVTAAVGGVIITGALASVGWRKITKSLSRPPRPLELVPNRSKVVTFHPRISYGFSSGQTQPPKDILLEALREAEQSLDIAVYGFNDLDIVLEMIKAHRRGVALRLIMDAQQFRQNHYQQKIVTELLAEGISIKVNVQEDASMHLNIAVVDGKTVTVGSFNFTTAAVNKNEEVLVRINDATLAGDWQRYFDYLWNDRRRYIRYREVERRSAQ